MSREPLDHINQQLQNTQGVDANQQAQLDALKQHIEKGLDDSEYHPTLVEELEEAVILFSDDHPELAAALRSAINILSSGGV